MEHEECARTFVRKDDVIHALVIERTPSHIIWMMIVQQINLWCCLPKMKTSFTQHHSKKDLVLWKELDWWSKIRPHEAKSAKLAPKTVMRDFWEESWISFVWRLFGWGQNGLWNFWIMHLANFCFLSLSLRKTCLQVFFLFHSEFLVAKTLIPLVDKNG